MEWLKKLDIEDLMRAVLVIGVIVFGLLAFAHARLGHADDDDPHACWAPGGDCVDYMKASGIFCQWAGEMATAGAYFRREKKYTLVQTMAQVSPRIKRPLTDNENLAIVQWLTFGWNAGEAGDELRMRDVARAACEARKQAL